jgi:dihydrofolate reductase
VYSSISTCLDALGEQTETVFVIGGSKVFLQFLNQDLLDGIWVSEVPGVHEGDVFFPEYKEKFVLEKEQAFETFVFKQYIRLP